MGKLECTTRLRAHLSISPVFAPLSAAKLKVLIESAECARYKADKLLYAEGESRDELIVVLDGELSITRNVDGQRMHMHALGAGSIVGWSIVAGRPHSADVRARTDLHVARIPGIEIRALLAKDGTFAMRVIQELGGIIEHLSNQIQQLRFDSLDDRLLHFLGAARDEEGKVRATHAQIAEELGVARENVTRALGRLRDRGLVETGRGWVMTLYGRVERALKERADRDGYIHGGPQVIVQEVAEDLGCLPEHVRKILIVMMQEGRLEVTRRRMRLLDED